VTGLASAKVYVGGNLVIDGTALRHRGGPLGVGVVSASSTRSTFTATASATPHTAGAWVELSASLTEAIDWITFTPTVATSSNAADSSTLLEFGVGGSGSESVISTIGVGYMASFRPITVPGHVAAGSRLVVRARSAISSQAVTGYFHLAGGANLGAPVSVGASTAASRGAVLTAPSSANTKSAWTEITASTSADLRALCISPQGGSSAAIAASNTLLDIAVGGAGAEVPILEDLFLVSLSTESWQAISPLTAGVSIPAGSRISARYARSAGHAATCLDLVLTGA
jgi:hypothetical protein